MGSLARLILVAVTGLALLPGAAAAQAADEIDVDSSPTGPMTVARPIDGIDVERPERGHVHRRPGAR